MLDTKEFVEEDLFELINGAFDPEEASEILGHLIEKKINFHGKKDFSSQIRFGTNDGHSLRRIAELKEAKGRILEIVENAKAENQQLRIAATISISPIPH